MKGLLVQFMLQLVNPCKCSTYLQANCTVKTDIKKASLCNSELQCMDKMPVEKISTDKC